jgi:Transposase IS66 family
MSDAVTSNKAEESSLVRCHCLAHGQRKFREWAEDFPAESAVVVEALKAVYDHDEKAREEPLRAQERLAYHQP